VNDLVARTKGHVEEVRNRHRWDHIHKRHDGADISNVVTGVSCHVEMLLGTDDVDIFSIVNDLA
jgi:hypothetical protein